MKVVGPRANPIRHLPRAAAPRVVFGVMGGAGSGVPLRVTRKLFKLGQAIAGGGNVVLTGACPGLPQVAVRGAKRAGGLTVGISPWPTLRQHKKAGSPVKGLDVLQLTRLPDAHRGQKRPNLMGREIDNIERSDVVIIAGGRSGTLGEFAIAYNERRPIGVLTGTGGITTQLKGMVDAISRAGKKPGAPIVFDSDPARLVKRLLKAHAGSTQSRGGGPLFEK